MAVHRPLVTTFQTGCLAPCSGDVAEDDAIVACVRACTQCGTHVFPLYQAFR
jgi:hypothetical protein